MRLKEVFEEKEDSCKRLVAVFESINNTRYLVTETEFNPNDIQIEMWSLDEKHEKITRFSEIIVFLDSDKNVVTQWSAIGEADRQRVLQHRTLIDIALVAAEALSSPGRSYLYPLYQKSWWGLDASPLNGV